MRGMLVGNASRLVWRCHLSRRTGIVSTLVLFLGGCIQTSGVFELTSVQRRSIAPIERARYDEPEPTPAYSETFWDAIAELDVPASRQAARTEAETGFAEGIAALITGDASAAEIAFRKMSAEESDPSVAIAAQLMFATTLLYEQKWAALSEFAAATQRVQAQSPGISGIEKWGAAFARVDSQVITFPQRAMTIPLRVTPVGTPTVRVRIAGKDYQFWLDTGSSMTILSSDVAAATGVMVLSEDTLTIATFAGVAPAKPALLSRMEIGSIIVANSPAIVIDSRLMRIQGTADGVPLSGLRVDGIIGWDVIRRFDILLDYANGKAIVRQPQDLGTTGTPSQNLKWVGKPFIRLQTKSGATLHLTLDTGAQASFLNEAVLKRAQVNATTSNARAYGIAGTGGKTSQAVSALRVDIGGKSVVLKDLFVYNPVASSLINCDGILGSDIAHFGTIRIDATNGLFSVG
jgi:predicted aspartyl protease